MNQYLCININFKTNILVEELDDEAAILNPENKHYYGLGTIGLRFWQFLTRHRNNQNTVTESINEYDLEEQTSHKDPDKLIVNSRTADLLENCHS